MVKRCRQTQSVMRMLKKRRRKPKRVPASQRHPSEAEQYADMLISMNKPVPSNVLAKLPKKWFLAYGMTPPSKYRLPKKPVYTDMFCPEEIQKQFC